jgi:hypothetical protein
VILRLRAYSNVHKPQKKKKKKKKKEKSVPCSECGQAVVTRWWNFASPTPQ